MPRAQFLERIFNWPQAPCLQIGESLANGFDSFEIFLALPFEGLAKHVVERCGGVLSMPLSVVVQLGLSLR